METNRRNFLRGFGTIVALPALEYFAPAAAFAQSSRIKRIFFFYIPNGANFYMNDAAGGLNLSDVLSPLNNVKDYVTVVNGLELATARGFRAGDHARGLSTFLTCVEPQFPGPGVAKSFDQVLADSIGRNSRFASLNLGTESGAGSDNGYSAAYNGNMSWLAPGTPNTKETEPMAVFSRMFGAGTASEQTQQQAQRFKYGKSVLDFVREESNALNRRLGSSDKSKLDEYLTGLRELESRLGIGGGSSAVIGANCKQVAPPQFNGGYEGRVAAMYELSYHALACDMTRVGTLLLANEASNVSYGFLGVYGGHHQISHDASPNGRAQIDTIVKWHVGQLAKFAERLRSTSEGNGNMLDNSLLVFGGGIADGARHNHDNLPILLIGRGGGIRSNRVVNAGRMPLANLYVTLAQRTGVQLPQFGDSNGNLEV